MQCYHSNCKNTIRCARVPFSLQEHHSVCKSTIRCARAPFSLQEHHSVCKEHHSVCKSTIRCARAPFYLQEYHSNCKSTIQCARLASGVHAYRFALNVNNVLARLELFIQHLDELVTPLYDNQARLCCIACDAV